ncbi:uncharacterized protein LOC125767206 isoform X2 [Anopheles funestus]|uniref:uncharacterized protein LOC125767206 isoform X2 n=1 Tax=Anopheles funestus TaxID=62324 RepID=UPI0020C730EE|nr:uncharacterized protein LOC125767206 isoform X2 [Anopheles funestus]
MSGKRMRETEQMYQIVKANIGVELFVESSTFRPNNVQAAATDVDPTQIGNYFCLLDENRMEEGHLNDDRLNIDDSDNIESDDNNYDDDNEVDTSYSIQELPNENEPFDEVIRNWALRTYQSHQALNSLLAILRSRTSDKLPKDSRTLLRTRQSEKEIVAIPGGELWYPGVRSVLHQHFGNAQPRVSSFSLNFFVDGLPLNKNTRKQFWPILMSIQEMPEVSVFMVGNFYGASKPKSTEVFLRPLVNELNELMQHGIAIANKLITVRVRAFIADSPARAFIKGVAFHNNPHGCQKCTVVGQHHNGTDVVYFPRVDAPARTDADFRALKYEDHHRENTPLVDLPYFDIIKDVISSDCRHQIDYGVTRTFVNGLKAGKLGRHRKWSVDTVNRVNGLLKNVEIPAEFHRKFRDIDDTDLWHASEFNMFLHYASFVVLKFILTELEYKHFMLYYCSIKLFSSNVYREYWPEADRMLKQFIVEYGTLYGVEHLNSNMHSLVHIYDDVCRFGPLESFSSYFFEGKLQHIKKSLRNGHKVLVQAANRISEQTTQSSNCKHFAFPYLESTHSGVTLHVDSNISLFSGTEDNWFLTKDFYIVQYSGAQKDGLTINIYGKTFNKITESHTFYYSHMMKDIYEADICDLSQEVMIFLTTDIKCKLVAIKTNKTSYVFVPFIHTLTE